jgi:hypothetical protein
VQLFHMQRLQLDPMGIEFVDRIADVADHLTQWPERCEGSGSRGGHCLPLEHILPVPSQELPVRLQRRVGWDAQAAVGHDQAAGVLGQAARHGQDGVVVVDREQAAIEHPVRGAESDR